MEKESQKMGFFSRIKIAVAKLEEYSLFLEEKVSVSVKYFFLIVLIFAVVMALVQTYEIMKMIRKGVLYIQNELPDFSYEEGNLTFSERIFAYDEEYDIYMIADTAQEVKQEVLQEYSQKIKTTGLIFLKDQLIYQRGSTQMVYHYTDLSNTYSMTQLNKSELLSQIESIGNFTMATTLFLVFLTSTYLVQLIFVLMDWLIMSLFAMIVARVCRIRMMFRHCFQISIYALTLSIILSMLYQIAYSFAGFYTEYFRVIYLLISYVYIVAVILMMKSDLLKQELEITKIVKIQKELSEEEERPEEKEREEPKSKPEEKPKSEENPLTDEPDGSEI